MSDPSPLQSYIERVDARLDQLLEPSSQDMPTLIEAMRYSCLAAGKRLRPALCLASAESLGCGRDPAVLDAACAIEMVHCFSLIHDDLPAMDNDDLRRGRPTCHVVYGESTAILAGDTLLAYAFEILAGIDAAADKKVGCVAALARAAGRFGLGGGQQMDLSMENSLADATMVRQIHLMKTARFMGSACEIGAILAGASDSVKNHLKLFGEHLGMAFQIVDDVLDVTESTEGLGKPAGSDVERGKATFPAAVGVEESRLAAQTEMTVALQHLKAADGRAAALESLAETMLQRRS